MNVGKELEEVLQEGRDLPPQHLLHEEDELFLGDYADAFIRWILNEKKKREERMEIAVPEVVKGFAESLAEIARSPSLDFDKEFTIKDGVKLSQKEGIRLMTETVKLVKEGGRTQNISMWVLGNIAHLTKQQGLDFGDVIETTDQSMSTINTALKTFEFFQNKRYDLSFSHHKEVAYMKGLPMDVKHELMATSEDRRWSVATMRKVARALKGILKSKKGGIGREDFEQAIDEALSYEQKPPTGKRFLEFHPESGEWAITDTVSKDGDEMLILEIFKIIQTPKSK